MFQKINTTHLKAEVREVALYRNFEFAIPDNNIKRSLCLTVPLVMSSETFPTISTPNNFSKKYCTHNLLHIESSTNPSTSLWKKTNNSLFLKNIHTYLNIHLYTVTSKTQSLFHSGNFVIWWDLKIDVLTN